MPRPQGAPELPPGFTYGHFEECNIQVPVPEGWATALSAARTGQSLYVVSPSLAEIGGNVTYETGFSVGMLPELPHDPSDVAMYLVNSSTSRGMAPTSDMETVSHAPFITHRRSFTHPGGFVGDLSVGPSSLYVSATANSPRGVVYMATFETPTPEWERFRDAARVIVHGLIFDPSMGHAKD